MGKDVGVLFTVVVGEGNVSRGKRMLFRSVTTYLHHSYSASWTSAGLVELLCMTVSTLVAAVQHFPIYVPVYYYKLQRKASSINP